MPKLVGPTRKHGKFNNPLSNWLAARMITNKIEDNAARLIDQLSSIDFINSRLPREILEDRSDPELPYCKLEYATRDLIRTLQNDRQRITVDIRPIDERLMTLALMFRQFVEHGDAAAAEMAKTALYRGIKEIRCKIPQNQLRLADAFVEVSSEYLNQWISLVELAQIYDHQTTNLADKRIFCQNDEARLEEQLEKIRERLLSDPEYMAAFNHIQNHNAPSELAQWTELQRELHAAMVDLQREQLILQMRNLSLGVLESEQSATLDKMYTLRNQLEEVPIVSDPDPLNELRESIDKFLEQLAASKQFDERAVSVRAREAAAESAERVLEALRDRHERYRDQAAADHKRILEEITANHEQDQPSADRNSRKKMPVSKLVAELYGEDFLRKFTNSD